MSDLRTFLETIKKDRKADLIEIDGPPARRLVPVGDPWATCRDGIVTALVTGGSVVAVAGEDANQLARIASSERVTI